MFEFLNVLANEIVWQAALDAEHDRLAGDDHLAAYNTYMDDIRFALGLGGITGNKHGRILLHLTHFVAAGN